MSALLSIYKSIKNFTIEPHVPVSRKSPLLLCGLCLIPASSRAEEALCVYTDAAGRFQQVRGQASVPAAYESKANCFVNGKKVASQATGSIPPNQVSRTDVTNKRSSPEHLSRQPGPKTSKNIIVEGGDRLETVVTTAGRFTVRWDRSFELQYGFSPLRATADAAKAASRTLKEDAFAKYAPEKMPEWHVTFAAGSAPANQSGTNVASGIAHPGVATPPANIYFVADRLIASEKSVGQHAPTEEYLAESVLHEIGHIVDFQLTGGATQEDAIRTEGFAAWFAATAAESSELIGKGNIDKRYRDYARQQLKPGGTVLRTSSDYRSRAAAAQYFAAIAKQRGIGDVIKVLRATSSHGISFFGAVQTELNMKPSELHALAADISK